MKGDARTEQEQDKLALIKPQSLYILPDPAPLSAQELLYFVIFSGCLQGVCGTPSLGLMHAYLICNTAWQGAAQV